MNKVLDNLNPIPRPKGLLIVMCTGSQWKIPLKGKYVSISMEIFVMSADQTRKKPACQPGKSKKIKFFMEYILHSYTALYDTIMASPKFS